ncbi:MAG TPA: DUF2461 domain-containing protein [Bacillota bacterium]|nr:DUF2461 domain-containing protein [Bacillota bacterium]
MRESYQFRGFTAEAMAFLRDLGANNNKSWFEANKPRYREYLLQPFQDLVADLSGLMLAIDPYFVTTPAVGKTISRIYRDTRFSKDKSLYRNNIWLTFKRSSQDWKEAPAYYFELTPEGYRYGMGFYSASKSVMDKFRESLIQKPEAFRKVIAFHQGPNPFTLEGEKYQRQVLPDLPESLREWYCYKSFYLASNHTSEDLLFSPELMKVLMEGFGMLAPLYHYLWEFI